MYIYVEGGGSEIALRFMHDFGEEGKNFATPSVLQLINVLSTRCESTNARSRLILYIYIIDGSIMRNNVYSCTKNFALLIL